jgi:multiple sugar transport system substrate-binding protein
MDGGDLFDGTTAATRTAFSQLSEALRTGMIPRSALDWDEDEVARAFSAGDLLFAKLRASSQFGAEAWAKSAPWPGGGELIGHGLAVSAYGRNLATAIDVIAWLTDDPQQMERFTDSGLGPVSSQAYQSPPLVDSVFALAVAQAKPRLSRSYYHQLETAVAEVGRPILLGQTTAQEALPRLAERLAGILAGG